MNLVGSIVVASGAALVLAAGPATAQAGPPRAAAGPAVLAAPTGHAMTAAGAPKPSVRWLCGKALVRRLIPACTHGKWEFVTIKKMRCLGGHGPYVGITGPAKLAYWAHRCFEQGEWEKW